MSSKKEQDLKEFLISTRKKIKPGITSGPVWTMQKAGKRIWNKRQKRHWRRTNLKKIFDEKKEMLKGYMQKAKPRIAKKKKGKK